MSDQHWPQLAARASLELPRRVVITGGASGIGLACGRLLHEAGSSVGLIGRSPDKLDAAAIALRNSSRGAQSGEPADIATESADVTDEAAMRAAIGRISARFGGLDALIISAGVALETGRSVADATVQAFRDTLDINVVGAFIAVQAALPSLVTSAGETGPGSDGASITIIGSDSGFVAVPGMAAYNASKGAVVQLTRALAVELYESHGVRVNSVAPSVVDTPMARHDLGDELMDNPTFPMQTAEDVAWSVAYLSSRQARAVNGHTMLSDFGYTGRSSFPA